VGGERGIWVEAAPVCWGRCIPSTIIKGLAKQTEGVVESRGGKKKDAAWGKDAVTR